MSLGAKLAIVAAAAALTVGLFFVLRSAGDDDGTATTPTTPTAPASTAVVTTVPGSTAPVTTAPATTGQTPTVATSKPLTLVQLTVKNGKPVGGVATPKAKEGDEVAVVVTADVSDQVRVDGYDLSANVAPGKPAAIHFTASKTGRFEIKLESRNELLAELSVDPR